MIIANIIAQYELRGVSRVRENERWQWQTQRTCFEVWASALRPRLHRNEGFSTILDPARSPPVYKFSLWTTRTRKSLSLGAAIPYTHVPASFTTLIHEGVIFLITK